MTKVLLDVPSQPHSGEMPPSQFPDDMVFTIKQVPYFDMVIAS